MNEFYRENESAPGKDCKPIRAVLAKDLNVRFLNDEKINISLSHLKLAEMAGSSIRAELKCAACSQVNLLSEACEADCFVSSSSDEW